MQPQPEPIEFRPNRLFGVIPEAGEAEAAVEELRESGFGREEILHLAGPEEAPLLDVRRRERGALEKLGSIFKADESRVADHYRRRAEQGAHIVRVRARGRDERHRAARVLARHRAADLMYFGRFGADPIDPAALEAPSVKGPEL